ncbi:MAG: hypothetical protein E7589_01315 [Ruminococcaceae bacterium]|nr:hypothetical protein [Oscillospiraceae bacterium]
MKVKSVSYVGERDVYNMEVADTHDFVIQGGVVAHNCADEARYFCMMRPIAPRMNAARRGPLEGRIFDALNIRREDLTTPPGRARVEIMRS